MAKPALLLYDPLGSPWAPKLKQHCAIQGIRLCPVGLSDLGRTVSALAQGLAAPAEMATVDKPSAIPEPLIILCFLSSPQLDRLLAALRRMEVPRSVLKAVLTSANADWTLSALYQELCRERLSMGG